MAVPAAAIAKAAEQAARALNDLVSGGDEKKPHALLTLAAGAAAGLVILTAAALTIIESPSAWPDALLEQIRERYTYIDGSYGTARSDTGTDYRASVASLAISDERKAVGRTALSLEGKVSYFWGGKSGAIGWDGRWGRYTKVTASGSPTTGTYRPFGLDCSGYVDWVFNNALGYVIGHGGGAKCQYEHCTPIAWTAAQPGDLVFYNGCEHVGIVVENDGGTLTIINCSSGQDNIAVMRQSRPSTSCFVLAGQPDIFDQ